VIPRLQAGGVSTVFVGSPHPVHGA
jgi:hypothetical protein